MNASAALFGSFLLLAVFRGGNIQVLHLDSIVVAIDNIGWLAVHVACNDIADTGIPRR